MKLVIFDLDGTLVDTLEDLANSGNYALAAHGFAPHPTESYKLFVGNGIQTLIERALPTENRTKETVEAVKSTFVEHYEMHAKDTSAPYPEIVPLLQQLKKEGYLISVASNKYHTATVDLVNYYFKEIRFDLVLGHRDGHPAKPNPDIVKSTLETLKITEENCYYLGDSSVDMLTAKAAKVKAIGVTWGFRSEDELRSNGAQEIIHTPLALLQILKSNV